MMGYPRWILSGDYTASKVAYTNGTTNSYAGCSYTASADSYVAVYASDPNIAADLTAFYLTNMLIIVGYSSSRIKNPLGGSGGNVIYSNGVRGQFYKIFPVLKGKTIRIEAYGKDSVQDRYSCANDDNATNTYSRQIDLLTPNVH